MTAAETTRWAGQLQFPDLVRANQAMVYSIAVHYLRDRAVAEEIAQDVFLELYRHLGELQSEAHVCFWLRKVASRRCIDAVRKRKLRAAVALEEAPEPATGAKPGDPLLDRTLRRLVAALPERARMITVLRYQEDLMPEEIAEILDMPVRSVKGHLQRSLAVLREKFKRMQEGPRHG